MIFFCPKQLILSQSDMTVILRTLSENLSENSDVPPPALPPTNAASSDSASNKESQGSTGPASSKSLIALVFLLLVFLFPTQMELLNLTNEGGRSAEFQGNCKCYVHK